MSDPQLQFLKLGARRIAFRLREGSNGPALVWLNGYRSDMSSTKATALDAWCAAQARPFLRFDYSGHGASSGRFEDGAISLWLEETLAVTAAQTQGPLVLIGSSMGGYLALLAAKALGPGRLQGMALIAPAVDMTHELMLPQASPEARLALERAGQWLRPSAYGEPYPITRAFIEDGAKHRLFGGLVRSYCPVRILQGMQDVDVPFAHAMKLVEHMPLDPVTLTLIRDGEHRLSRPQDLALLTQAVESLAGA